MSSVPRLPDAVTSIGRLFVVVRIEIDVMNDDGVGCRQIDPVPASLGKETKQICYPQTLERL